jgi:hypothetical protein
VDITAFDQITKRFATAASRREAMRTVLGATLAGSLTLLGLLPEADAKKRKRPGKKKKRQNKGQLPPPGPACPAVQFIDGVCCPTERIFVKCPDVCLCEADPDFCCATSGQLPPNCPTGADTAPALCCPGPNVCGDVCCDPWMESCAAGQCQCNPENQCGAHCCDPRFFACNTTTQVCDCILPNPLDCPSGSGGFLRVRRLP